MLYDEAVDAKNRANLANELLIFHMQVSEEDVQSLVTRAQQQGDRLPDPDFDKFTYLPRPCEDKLLGVIYAIRSLGFDKKFNVPLETLCRFILRVQKGYRDNPYHNWTHAFAVFHCAYLLIKNLNLQQTLGDLACYSYLIAALCHDLDHRGTNSAFEISVQSPLSALYSSKGSVMERHHFAQTIALLNVHGTNIFCGMESEDNQKALDYVQLIILATDLAVHLRLIKDINNLASRTQESSLEVLLKEDTANVERMVLSLLMTSADLSDQTKDWKTTKNTANIIYEEFFNQGDLEKDMGLQPSHNYDREQACVPDIQIGFMEHVAQPAYKILSEIFPSSKEIYDRVLLNFERWRHISEEWQKLNKPTSESMSILTSDFDQQVLSKYDAPINPFL